MQRTNRQPWWVSISSVVALTTAVLLTTGCATAQESDSQEYWNHANWTEWVAPSGPGVYWNQLKVYNELKDQYQEYGKALPTYLPGNATVIARQSEDSGYEAWYQSKKVPGDRIEKKEEFLLVFDDQGSVIVSIPLTREGRLIASGGSYISIQAKPKVHRPAGPATIGITLGAIDEVLATHLGVDADDVVLVTRVEDGRPAKKAGLERFDVITGMNGESSANAAMLQEFLSAAQAGDRLDLALLRKGEGLDIAVTVEESASDGIYQFWPNIWKSSSLPPGRYLLSQPPRPYMQPPAQSYPHPPALYTAKPRSAYQKFNAPTQSAAGKAGDTEIVERLDRLEKSISELRKLIRWKESN